MSACVKLKPMKRHRLAVVGLMTSAIVTTSLVMIVIVHATNDLYTDQDAVLRLNELTFIPTVYHTNKDTVFMVQFYNSYCGHCQAFAPIYKELAQRVHNWTIFRVAGVDCSKEENMATCNDDNIQGYPTLLLFPPNGQAHNKSDGPTNFREIRSSRWNLDELEEGIIDYMLRLIGRPNVPLVIHHLRPVTSANMEQFFRDSSLLPADNHRDTNKDLMFVIETANSYIGRKLILEMSVIHARLELRVVQSNNTQMVESLLPPNYDKAQLTKRMPLLVRYVKPTSDEASSSFQGNQVLLNGGDVITPANDHNNKIINDDDQADYSYNRLRNFIQKYYTYEIEEARERLALKAIADNKDHYDLAKPSLVGASPQRHRTSNEWMPFFQKGKVYSSDLIRAIRYMIHHEILVKGDLKPNHYLTFKSLLDLLLKFIPLEQWDKNAYNYLRTLKQQLDTKHQHYETSGLSHQEFNNILHNLDKLYVLPDIKHWMYCQSSELNNKGYPCSLWTLFHVMTVSEFMKAPPSWGNLHAVLYAMRDYIVTFFGCTDCAHNFRSESASLENHLTHRNSSILWLWQIHNKVNRRLHYERPVDKRKPDDMIIFPTSAECPACYKGQYNLETTPIDEIDWNMPEVFKFLLNRYRPDHVLHSDLHSSYKRRPESSEDHARKFAFEGESQSDWRSNFLSTGDMGIVFILYLICVVIIVSVCVALNPRVRTNYRKLSRSMLAYNV